MSDERTKDENTTSGTKKITFLSLLIIQMGVILYTGSGICSKMTANYDAFSCPYPREEVIFIMIQ